MGLIGERKFRTKGPFPCAACPATLSTRRNRRRHAKLLHRDDTIKPPPMSFNQEQRPGPSGESRAASSRSARARQLHEEEIARQKREAAEILETLGIDITRKLTLEEIDRLEKRNVLVYHQNMYIKNKLCRLETCGPLNPICQRFQPNRSRRAKANFFHCDLCGKEFKKPNCLRQHLTSAHGTKASLAEANAHREPVGSDSEYSEFEDYDKAEIESGDETEGDDEKQSDSNGCQSSDRPLEEEQSPDFSGPTRL